MVTSLFNFHFKKCWLLHFAFRSNRYWPYMIFNRKIVIIGQRIRIRMFFFLLFSLVFLSCEYEFCSAVACCYHCCSCSFFYFIWCFGCVLGIKEWIVESKNKPMTRHFWQQNFFLTTNFNRYQQLNCISIKINKVNILATPPRPQLQPLPTST